MSIRTPGFYIGASVGALAHILVFGLLDGPFLLWLFIGQSISSGMLTVSVINIQQRRQESATRNGWFNRKWTPPYAPDFIVQQREAPAIHGDFTVEGVSARRARAEALSRIDNTEFVDELFAYRCKTCSAVYVYWDEAFECHKG